ncbi:hypothetical protein [Nostoc sphaeroides]|nr:hypothetical protein [Nostoc sphaeroides]
MSDANLSGADLSDAT